MLAVDVQVKDFTEPELRDVISQRQLPASKLQQPCEASTSSAVPKAQRAAKNITPAGFQLQQAAARPLAQLATALSSTNAVPAQLSITLREVMKILRRHVYLHLSLPDAVVSLLAARVQYGSAEAEQLQQHLRALGGEFGTLTLPTAADYSLVSLGHGKGVRFAASPSCYVDIPSADLSRIKPVCNLTPALQQGLVQVAFAVAAEEPVMLMGPTCFKTTLFTIWATLLGRDDDVARVHLSPGGTPHARCSVSFC